MNKSIVLLLFLMIPFVSADSTVIFHRVIGSGTGDTYNVTQNFTNNYTTNVTNNITNNITNNVTNNITNIVQAQNESITLKMANITDSTWISDGNTGWDNIYGLAYQSDVTTNNVSVYSAIGLRWLFTDAQIQNTSYYSTWMKYSDFTTQNSTLVKTTDFTTQNTSYFTTWMKYSDFTTQNSTLVKTADFGTQNTSYFNTFLQTERDGKNNTHLHALANLTGSSSSTACSGTDKVTQVTLNNGAISSTCGTDQTGGGSATNDSHYHNYRNVTGVNLSLLDGGSSGNILVYNGTQWVRLAPPSVEGLVVAYSPTLFPTTGGVGWYSAVVYWGITSDVNWNTSSLTTLTGALVSANTSYSIDCRLNYQSNNTASGIGLAITTTNTTSSLAYVSEIWGASNTDASVGTSTISYIGQGTASADTILSPSTFAADTTYVAKIEGTVVTINPGYILIQFRPEVNLAKATIKEGSMCYVLAVPV